MWDVTLTVIKLKEGDCVKRLVYTDHFPGGIETILFVEGGVVASQEQAVGAMALVRSNVIYKRHTHSSLPLNSTFSDNMDMLTAAVQIIRVRAICQGAS